MNDDIWSALDKCIDDSITNINNYEQINLKKKKKKNNIKNIPFVINITENGSYCILDNIENINKNELERKLRNYFTIRIKNIMGYFDITKNYYYISKITNNKKHKILYLPRFGAFLLEKKFSNISFINNIKIKNPIPNLQWNGNFIGNQQIVYDKIIESYFNSSKLEQGKAGLVLNLEAGQGKSFLAMGLISKLKCRTLIVTHNSTILFQWVTELEKLFPNNKIGLYYGKKKVYGDIIVGIINSLTMDNIKFKNKKFVTPQDFYDTIDFCIFDECHEYCSPSRSKIYNICQSPYMLGLSATPEYRENDIDNITKWNIGPILNASELDGYTVENIPFTGKVHMVKYLGPPEYTKQLVNEKLAITSVPLMIDQLSKDPYRLNLIVQQIIKHINKKLNIFVFADRRSYLEKIKEKLDEVKEKLNEIQIKTKWMTTIKEYKAMTVMGGCTSEDVDKASIQANIIFTTYQFMGTGKSIPKMDCIILCTPRKSKSKQTIGRIFRMGGDYSIERQIIDIVDWKTSLKTQWYKRKKYYDEKKYPIEVKKVLYKDIKNYN